MRISCQLRHALLAFVASVVAGVSTLAAQGITTAAVSGVVTDSVGQPIEAAQIQVTNQQTGVTQRLGLRARTVTTISRASRSVDRT